MTSQNLETNAGHLMVCHAVKRDDWISDALFDVYPGEYTPTQWRKVLRDLAANRLTIKEWIF